MTDTALQPRLILHIGVQKTASTSMQGFLAQNRKALASEVRVFTPWRETPAQLLGRRALDFSTDPSPRTEANFVTAIGTMRAVLTKETGTCLISHENLVGAMPGAAGANGFYANIDRIIAVLDRELAPLRPHYVYYTRDMAAWKRSVHNQAIKTDGYVGRWTDFMAETAQITDWGDFDARLRAAAGPDRVTQLRLEDEVDPTRPGQQLLRLAGVTDRMLTRLKPMSERRNEGLNAGALEFMRRVNAEGFTPHIRYRLGLLIAQSQSLFSTSVGLTRD
jgi:hypothetical protein